MLWLRRRTATTLFKSKCMIIVGCYDINKDSINFAISDSSQGIKIIGFNPLTSVISTIINGVF